MIYQTDRRLDRNLNHYGCYFVSLAYFRPFRMGHDWTASELQEAWLEAIRVGAITGDLNTDGDMDDDGEAVIVNPDLLCHVLGLPLKYKDGHFPLDTPIPEGAYVITEWYNPDTKFRHFVVGQRKPAQFDPIGGGSRTVREGYPVSLRIYERVEA